MLLLPVSGDYYREILSKAGNYLDLKSWFEKNRFGRAFTWMLGYGRYDNEREKSFQSYHSNLFIMALKKDQVIPLKRNKTCFWQEIQPLRQDQGCGFSLSLYT